MGCGSSTTSVQNFRNPEENKNYRSQKAPSRQPSAAPSLRSQRSTDIKDKQNKRKTSASSSSSFGSRRQNKADEESRSNTASTKKTYTIQRPTSDVTHDYTSLPVSPHDENGNNETKVETPVQTFENGVKEHEIDEQKLEAQKHHEDIQKQTFITGDPVDELHYEENKPESHEEIARRKEEIRSQYSYEKLEEDIITDYGLVALTIPEMEGGDKNIEYTIDDIIEHNDEVADLDWFKYGKKIYSWRTMQPIIQERVDQYKRATEDDCRYWCTMSNKYPIHVARSHGVSRKELASVLAVCQVGNCIDIPREEYLARMKQSAENVLEEDTDSEYFKDYRNQLGRWIADYPMNKVYNDPPNPEADPNEVAFPLPPDILSDPYVLRKWTETWMEFDCVVPEEGAWEVKPLLKDDWGDIHEIYANAVREHHDDGSMEPLDMTIDGDVAWTEIDLDLFKNDKTTESQESIWKTRATRTNLNDPEWMKKRREELAIALKTRYELRQITYPYENFMSFTDILEQHWKEFQELCEKEFIRPQGNYGKTKQSKLAIDEHQQIDGGDVVFTSDGVDNRLVIGHESENEGSTDKVDANKRLSINHEDGVHDQVAIDPVNGGSANDIPALETMDSGLELDSTEPFEQGSVEKDIGKIKDDSIQLTDRPETDGSGNNE